MSVQQLNVLIVEDNAAHLALITRAFEDDSSTWNLQHASTLKEAKSLLAKQQLDLLLLDNRLPDGEGIELLPGSVEGRQFPIIMMTAYGDEKVAVEALKSGALDYIVKSEQMFAEMPHMTERALREWGYIVDCKQHQQTIKNSEEKFRSVTETAQDAIIMLDNNGEVSLWNQAAERMLGYSQQEVLGKEMHSLIIPEAHRKRHQQGWTAYRNTGQGGCIGKTVELTALHRSGKEFPIELSLSATRISDSWYAIGIIRDISERKQAEDSLKNSLEGTIEAIALAVEARDPYTAGHQRRVSDISVAIAREMNLDEDKVEGIHWGAMIHDIGKINLPAEILSKPSKLSDTEYSLIQGHAQVGYGILKNIEFPWPVADIAYQHHERVDGSGYPQGLKGDEICLEARIVAVADVVEAISSHRPYRPSLGIDVAMDEIKNKRGKFYDPVAVDACLKLFTEKRLPL